MSRRPAVEKGALAQADRRLEMRVKKGNNRQEKRLRMITDRTGNAGIFALSDFCRGAGASFVHLPFMLKSAFVVST
jgi:hypothetical protein